MVRQLYAAPLWKRCKKFDHGLHSMCQAVRRLAAAVERRPATALALTRKGWTAEIGYLCLQLLYKLKRLGMRATAKPIK